MNQNQHSIYSLQFLGTSAQETVVQAAIKQFDISLNILFANMTEINGSVINRCLFSCCDPDIIQETIAFF